MSDPKKLREDVIREITVAPGWNKADATALVDELILSIPYSGQDEARVIDNCIYLVQQSLDTVRAEDDGESRWITASIAAREHVIRLLAGYRDNVLREATRP